MDELPPDHFLFTSEFACEGHPDKLCDTVADAILDAALAEDPNSKVSIEVCTKTDVVMVLGEVSSTANINYEQIVRDVVKDAGYISEDLGLDWRTVNIVIAVEEQSPDLASAVHLHRSAKEIGAGDQGSIFGFACDETESALPLSLTLSRDLVRRLKMLRVEGKLPWLRPDGKTQVTVQYKKEKGRWVPVRVHTLIISAQHSASVQKEEIEEALQKEVVAEVIPSDLLDDKTVIMLNPSKKFIVGGPRADAGLSGRKLDHLYGGRCMGNAIHGKDGTKIEHSATYGARCAAKSLVKAGLCSQCLVQVSYSIGHAQPIAIYVDSFGTAEDDHVLTKKVASNFDFSVNGLITQFDLKKQQFKSRTAFGPFDDDEAPWEQERELK